MANWDDLKRELELWGKAGQIATLWWRDDDAMEASPALDRLLDYGTPIHLAMIPGLLKEKVHLPPHIYVAQHGFDHCNRAGRAEKKSEFPASRNEEEILQDLTKGFHILQEFYGRQFQPLFVPPWNRFDHPAKWWRAGLKAISRFAPYPSKKKQPEPEGDGYRSFDTNIDLIDWKTRSFIGEGEALDKLCVHLAARRLGSPDVSGPTGILTHHLLHDAALWAFLDNWQNFIEYHSEQMNWIAVEVELNG